MYQAIVWISGFLLFYIFMGYYFLLVLLNIWKKGKDVPSSNVLPRITIILVIRNEEKYVVDRIKNLLDQYPSNLIEMIIVLDACTDRTVELVNEIYIPNVQFIQENSRKGKASGVKKALDIANEDIVVFADARQLFVPGTIKKLVRHFCDPHVGAVSGELILTKPMNAPMVGVDIYWELEKLLRKAESKFSSIIGCTGAIYAVRRQYCPNLREDTILDDVVIPLYIAQKGLKVIFESEAKAVESSPRGHKDEFKRKIRTIAGNFQMLFRYPSWLLPWKHQLWWQLISHKYLRLLSPYLLLLIFFSSLQLINHSFYNIIFYSQLCFYFLAFIGLIFPRITNKIISLPSGFLLLNIANIGAIWMYSSGKYSQGWRGSE